VATAAVILIVSGAPAVAKPDVVVGPETFNSSSLCHQCHQGIHTTLKRQQHGENGGKLMKRLGSLAKAAAGMTIVLALVPLGGYVNAFSQYSFVKNDNFPPPDAPQYNGCRTCHGDFNGVDTEMSGQTWPSNLMDTHVDFMVGNGDCSTCHSSGPRFPVQLGSSAGGELLEPISCAGCHGREEDGTPDPGDGTVGYGLGLRRHHWNADVTIDLDPDPVGELLITTRVCANCHADADPAGGAVPVAENVKPPYYADPDGGAHARGGEGGRLARTGQ
jgi:hypothetical protein